MLGVLTVGLLFHGTEHLPLHLVLGDLRSKGAGRLWDQTGMADQAVRAAFEHGIRVLTDDEGLDLLPLENGLIQLEGGAEQTMLRVNGKLVKKRSETAG